MLLLDTTSIIVGEVFLESLGCDLGGVIDQVSDAMSFSLYTNFLLDISGRHRVSALQSGSKSCRRGEKGETILLELLRIAETYSERAICDDESS
jgi:hypothetical protein